MPLENAIPAHKPRANNGRIGENIQPASARKRLKFHGHIKRLLQCLPLSFVVRPPTVFHPPGPGQKPDSIPNLKRAVAVSGIRRSTAPIKIDLQNRKTRGLGDQEGKGKGRVHKSSNSRRATRRKDVHDQRPPSPAIPLLRFPPLSRTPLRKLPAIPGLKRVLYAAPLKATATARLVFNVAFPARPRLIVVFRGPPTTELWALVLIRFKDIQPRPWYIETPGPLRSRVEVVLLEEQLADSATGLKRPATIFVIRACLSKSIRRRYHGQSDHVNASFWAANRSLTRFRSPGLRRAHARNAHGWPIRFHGWTLRLQTPSSLSG